MTCRYFAFLALLVAACAATEQGVLPPDAPVDGPPDAPLPPDARPPDATVDARPDAPRPDACVPTGPTEVCNGKDDDCNGTVDDGFDVGENCTVGQGVCRKMGEIICNADAGVGQCSVSAGMPGDEICGNDADDDCDGETDEGFEDLGQICTEGKGICERQGLFVCSVDRLELDCSATPGTPGPAELCGNNLDDDCDGQEDEGFELLGTGCSVGVGACQRPGLWACTLDKTMLVCNATPGTPGPNELCGNHIDDNCNGQEDEGFSTVGMACDGPDVDLCNEGTIVCNPDLLGVSCSDTTGNNPDVCNAFDDDCDPITLDGAHDPNNGALCDSTSDTDQCLEGNLSCVGGFMLCGDPANDDTTNDPDACGNCATICANPNGGRFCTNSQCTPTCNFGWQACGDPKLGCLSLRNTNATCPGENIGTIEGDGGGGGDNGTNIFHREEYQEKQYFFHVDDVGDCFHDSTGVLITFKNPPNVRFRVCSRCFDCPGQQPEVCREPGVGATVSFDVTAFDNCGVGADDGHWQIVRVEYLSGDTTTCNNWTLDIKGNRQDENDRTCGGDT